MNIKELLEKLQDNFHSDDLNGELILHGNCIIWEYNLDKDAEEIEIPIDEQEDELNFSFETSSSEELLEEAYHEDLELIKEFLDGIEELDNWTFSDSETNDNIISFKIF
jgi:hypothetical protein